MSTKTLTKTKWTLDPTHSEVRFKVKHMMITNVSGSFQNFDVNAETEGDSFETATIRFTADANSISTGNADRDNHLKAADFFEAEKYAQLVFVSTAIDKNDNERFLVHGDLTIREVTRPVVLNVEYGGIGKDPWGNEKAGFTVTGTINRSDFKLNWNAALETGGVLVSDEVRLHADIQLVKKA